MNGAPIAFRTVGEPFDSKKKDKNPRWNGKQMITQPSKKQHCDARQQGYFSKLVYQHEEYFQQIPYSKTQPLDQRKLGFGSKDAFKQTSLPTPLPRQYTVTRSEKNKR